MEDINNLSYLRVSKASVRFANSLGTSVPSLIASRDWDSEFYAANDFVDLVLGLSLSGCRRAAPVDSRKAGTITPPSGMVLNPLVSAMLLAL